MSEKDNNKIRSIDDDGYRQRAACICVRNEREDEILLITSRHKTSWIIPGGGIEQNESTNEAAQRELFEEAGVKGRIIRDLGVIETFERKWRTHVFVVYVEHEYDDWEEKILIGRQRHWFHLNEAFFLLNSYKQSQLSFLQRFILTLPNCIQLVNHIKDS
ncbi:unnamed protein product [Rotaria sp. Silwood2]|nr:unnamed protein product [Rotaria sp. Silwood2]CAF2888471.1 unnamed protein product [Rotaria sp. Silwood2]CAF3175381.1 unnamed protein product [Rotaria sp. Silwood2]CAF3551751.1 unnamed protein product [Rotaria sp. Silwood2]CAF4448991.1 unnamed protein product [Rotaria sp. Silwood2]